MSLAARVSSPARRSAFPHLGAASRAVRRAIRRRWGVREFVCSAFGELMGLQVGATVSFYLINADLMPRASEHLAWSLSLVLGGLAGSATGWWIARVSRQEPQRVRVK
jgi:hypothetical protein